MIILYLESHPDIREILSRSLRSKGHTVTAVASVAEAWEALRTSVVEIAILTHSKHDGTADVRDMANHLNMTKILPVVVIMNNATEEFAHMPNVLSKPFRPIELEVILEELSTTANRGL